jgi:hypothetical protein
MLTIVMMMLMMASPFTNLLAPSCALKIRLPLDSDLRFLAVASSIAPVLRSRPPPSVCPACVLG